ncbi:MAG: bifunctional diaminohydroxyphosphoribosylaminopyrimidine deaminase/5-amino-6-(5-phosphoribosylamino)uracil reductase RibD [Proteobacteria bacterium]|nr:bifunctional diaminohydroxyphosphoribosylaminopyrimidine deaminase/5-amino-6-(5-phosphoribosylamino)uracil reductase RibD [Pseudomonadota bacterium]
MPDKDTHFLNIALDLGRRMLGQTAPNPAVGCVIVKDGVIVGQGVTQKGGRPHAETEALKEAGDKAKGATVYVSIEPCAHKGRTGSCASALIKAGVARVVAPLEDPDPRVSGKGFHMLHEAGIEVLTGLCEEEAERVNEGFLKRMRYGRPMFTLKLATSLDGRIATAKGESRWISGEESRAYAHRLRATHDGIMVGIGTVRADNPLLSCRLPGLEEFSPIRIVVDRKLRLPFDSQLVRTARQYPLWIITSDRHEADHVALYEQEGAKIVSVPVNEEGYADPLIAARKLGELGLTRVLIEGGAHLAAAFLREDLVDRLEWVTAPLLLGSDALPAMEVLGRELLADHPRFKSTGMRLLGQDRLESFVRAG